jgi:NhaP-type Na+/H+ or K+/H+ antiporter
VTEELLLGLAAIIVLGILAQWLAWRLHLPSILLLLIFGFVAGPLAGVVQPDRLFGDLLFPLVSVSVAIILFEGGLGLKLDELRRVGGAVTLLTTVGILVTWALAAVAAWLVTGLSIRLAILLGAILVVSGPTVIIPLLRQVRPVSHVASIVRWEGIVNDPIGAILAVLVFQVVMFGPISEAPAMIALGVGRALLFGTAAGIVAAGIIVLLLRRYLIPDFLQNPFSLMLVVMTYYASNALQPEAGLLAVTVMGIALANQKFVSVRHISEFKESLRVILISSLFVILAARLPVGQPVLWQVSSWLFVGVLILLVRPAAVLASTWGTKLTGHERLFLACVAPRGIVAAAVASIFAMRLSDVDVSGAEALVPLTFITITGTVAVYGLGTGPVARLLKVARPGRQGILFAGAQRWVREIALLLKEEGFQVALVDSNRANVAEARQAGCRAYYGNILAQDLLSEIELDGLGRLLALTPNHEVNALATLHFSDIFGRQDVYQLTRPEAADKGSRSAMASHLRGRFLFGEKATYDYLSSRFAHGAVVKKTSLTEKFDYEAFRATYGPDALPLMVITPTRQLKVYTTESDPSPAPGETLISIVDEPDKT